MAKPVSGVAPGNKEYDARADLKWLCESALKEAFPAFRTMSIHACFYPYIGLTHTIRRKGSVSWEVRISDHCRRAPSSVLEAIIMILGNKVMHKRTPRKFLEIYEHFRKEPSILESVHSRRLKKGKKHFAEHAGKYHVLQEFYREINRQYFNNQVEIGRIGWGIRKSRARLGHYDPVHHTVTLSPILDSPDVPPYVLRFIVYHEMLHAVFEGTSCHAVHVHHPPEFRRAERAHPDYASAKKFLKSFCSKKH
jgi:predicted metal-dependent hydrolase